MALLKNISLSQELQLAGLEPDVVQALLKTSYSLSLNKGDRFNAGEKGAMIIFFRSGYLFDQLDISAERRAASLLWTPGYVNVTLPKELNEFERNNIVYSCLYQAEITVISKESVYHLMPQSTKLFNYVLKRSAEFLCASRDMALLRSSLDKRQNIILRLLTLTLSMEDQTFNLTIDDLCTLTGANHKYCGEYIKQLESLGIVKKGYGSITVLNTNKLMEQLHPDALMFYQTYLNPPSPKRRPG